jgi:hypothetical protein
VNPRLLSVVLGCLLVGSGVLALVAGRLDESPPARTVAAAPPRPEPEALVVLRAWDERRSRAWARGDPAALRGLYTPGSRSGRADRAMLAAYAERGMRVTGLRTQVLAADVRRRSARAVSLVVTDRLVGGVAVGGGVREPLPVDRPSTWLVSLVRVAGEWRVAEVQANPAASTAPTSGWWNR